MVNIRELAISPEEYDIGVYKELPKEISDISLMTDSEKRFLNGLVRLCRPRRILEIGVHKGGGSAVILNAVKDMPQTTLTSIDIAEYVDGEQVIIGDVARRLFSKRQKQWTLITGKDPVEIIEELDERYDFCILDSSHIHPVESLNFLTLFPFLTHNAIIVLHDISGNLIRDRTYSGARLLLDTVAAEKTAPKQDLFFNVVNISAFQITEDTRKYIGNTFDMLNYAWDFFPPCLKKIAEFIKRHYEPQYSDVFLNAYCANAAASIFRGDPFKNNEVVRIIKHAADNVLRDLLHYDKLIFFGRGEICHQLINLFEHLGYRLPDEIWDINEKRVNTGGLRGIKVVEPRFDSLVGNSSCSVVIALWENESLDFVKSLFKRFGVKEADIVCLQDFNHVFQNLKELLCNV